METAPRAVLFFPLNGVMICLSNVVESRLCDCKLFLNVRVNMANEFHGCLRTNTQALKHVTNSTAT